MSLLLILDENILLIFFRYTRLTVNLECRLDSRDLSPL